VQRRLPNVINALARGMMPTTLVTNQHQSIIDFASWQRMFAQGNRHKNDTRPGAEEAIVWMPAGREGSAESGKARARHL
jgi:hypothetical protein